MEIPYGYCHCGCGQLTNIANQSKPSKGTIKGQPNKYLKGHKPKGMLSRKSHATEGYCIKCKEVLPINEFRFLKGSNIYASVCTVCDDARKAGSRYGLTTNEYLQFVKGKPCQICGKVFSTKSRTESPQIDHCHKTGRIRGVLCGPCNRLVAQSRENADILRKAADYVDRFVEDLEEDETVSEGNTNDTA